MHGVSRREAWAGALHAAGLPEGPCVRSDFSAQGGADATKALLDLPEPPTAIVYANDLMAIAGMAVAASRGLDVPGDLSITGFDDTEVSAHLQPALTTVRTDAYAWGQAAAKRLMATVEGSGSTERLAPAAVPRRPGLHRTTSGTAHAGPPRNGATMNRTAAAATLLALALGATACGGEWRRLVVGCWR